MNYQQNTKNIHATDAALKDITESAMHYLKEKNQEEDLDNMDSDSDAIEEDLLDESHFTGLSNNVTKIYSNSNQKPIVQAMQFLFEVRKCGFQTGNCHAKIKVDYGS